MALSFNKQKGKAYVSIPAWREKLDAIVGLLRAIRSRYGLAQRDGTLRVGHDAVLHRRPAQWMDETRMQAFGIIGEFCREASVTPPQGPRHRPLHC